jgi:hypothetical protein
MRFWLDGKLIEFAESIQYFGYTPLLHNPVIYVKKRRVDKIR